MVLRRVHSAKNESFFARQHRKFGAPRRVLSASGDSCAETEATPSGSNKPAHASICLSSAQQQLSTRGRSFADRQQYRRRQFLGFEEARAHVRQLGLKCSKEWEFYSRTARPAWIPSTPSSYYRHTGFAGFSDFCGYDRRPRAFKQDSSAQPSSSVANASAKRRKQHWYARSHSISAHGIRLFLDTMREVAPQIRFTIAPRMSRTSVLFTLDSPNTEAEHERWATLLVYSTLGAKQPQGVSRDPAHHERTTEIMEDQQEYRHSEIMCPNSGADDRSTPRCSSPLVFLMKAGAHGAGIIGIHLPTKQFFARSHDTCCRNIRSARALRMKKRECHVSSENATTSSSGLPSERQIKRAESADKETGDAVARQEFPHSLSSAEVSRARRMRHAIYFRSEQAVKSPQVLASLLQNWWVSAEKRRLSEWFCILASCSVDNTSQKCMRLAMHFVYEPLRLKVDIPSRDVWTYNTLLSGRRVLHRVGKPMNRGQGYDVYLARRDTAKAGVVPIGVDDPIDFLVVYVLRSRQGLDLHQEELTSLPNENSGLLGMFVIPRHELIPYFQDRNEEGRDGFLRVGLYAPHSRARNWRCLRRKEQMCKYYIDFAHGSTSEDAWRAELEKARQILS
ncbi:unnamed protein product [Amoebophrya sp. A25]|nr:unnamed protein product [Amoebophrya sp. A25]|eukprot:GSA25T00026545001.1